MDNDLVLSERAEMVGQALLRAVLPSASLLTDPLRNVLRDQVQRGLQELRDWSWLVASTRSAASSRQSR